MAKSLADQLKSAGLVDDKKAKQIQQEKRKQKKQQFKGQAAEDDTRARLQKQKQEKAERDRQLNQERRAAEDARAMQAQAAQMLQHNRQPVDGEVRFNFTDPRINKIKRLYVTSEIQDQLAKGRLAICADGDQYVVVPKAIAEKVAERFPEALISLADPKANEVDEDDPYKDFPIPDDLMW
ncbi:MAG: DUF2058 domain-containing protein [Natronospirillum sp.]|uniref:DUF2058 domain-containing protein n=1 Tax=Natronospirillum sp. TaxID=2812955 RepID=UPI0025D5E256|nr:DUF2058 domain-containing protein [Natronospirillum sp.]MCH8551011.1 DUF2058 domain-containing protein [Natronospirillum sp.]